MVVGEKALDLTGGYAMAPGGPVAVVGEVGLAPPALARPAQGLGQVQHGDAGPRADVLQLSRDLTAVPIGLAPAVEAPAEAPLTCLR